MLRGESIFDAHFLASLLRVIARRVMFILTIGCATFISRVIIKYSHIDTSDETKLNIIERVVF